MIDSDWVVRARSPWWQFDLVDEAGNTIKRLDTVTGGSLEVNTNTRLKYSGQLTLTTPPEGAGVDFLRHRVKITYHPFDGDLFSIPLGVLMFAQPDIVTTQKDQQISVGLLSELLTVDEDAIETPLSLPEGARIIPAVVSLLALTGVTRYVADESDITLKSALVWDAGESKLTIINKLLQAAGYWALSVDGAGVFQIKKYTPPSGRLTMFDFRPGVNSVHRDGFKTVQNLTNVPNKVICIAQGTDEEPPLVGVAVNEDADSPFSYTARGRWVTRVYDSVEAASQKVIDLSLIHI